MHHLFGRTVVFVDVVQRPFICRPIPFIDQVYFDRRTVLNIVSLIVFAHQPDVMFVAGESGLVNAEFVRLTCGDVAFRQAAVCIHLGVFVSGVRFDLHPINTVFSRGNREFDGTVGEYPCSDLLHDELIGFSYAVCRYSYRIIIHHRRKFRNVHISRAFYAQFVSSGNGVYEHVIARRIGHGAVHCHAFGIRQRNGGVIQSDVLIVFADDRTVYRPVNGRGGLLAFQQLGQIQIQQRYAACISANGAVDDLTDPQRVAVAGNVADQLRQPIADYVIDGSPNQLD